MTDSNRIQVLMARKVAGEATSEELEELELLLLKHPSLQYAFNIIADIQLSDSDGFTEEEEETLKQSGMGRLTQWLDEQPVIVPYRFPWKTFSALAAGVALLIGTYILWPKQTERTYANEVITRNGSKTTLVLPDGSSVVLNACSRLQYDANSFLKGDRTVSLIGEAFFDIKHDPAHPFIVHSGDVNIKVLGTSFNVKAYTEDASVETSLISGKVAVEFSTEKSQHHKEVILLPSQKLTINKLDIIKNSDKQKLSANFSVAPIKTPAPVESETTPGPPTAWMDDRFEFDNLNLEDLSHDLERWYNVKISFKDDKYKKEVFTGAFKKQTIEDVLNALQLTLGFHYQLDKDQHTVTIW
ncbi:FecR family protein [Chitinophaga sp. Cy-1792]|uniref:FecR family protein n=1 Tax=Chitinophaga sp. Cy-1792 TaxID=2608339 RepID=UPI0014227294|nr:FecR domain-containing protein [Chitinophaga sp. Cy-1792]NIG56937.1 DUF4974 domain-containing protein [Chitinophaga sp. Cy-1792]